MTSKAIPVTSSVTQASNATLNMSQDNAVAALIECTNPATGATLGRVPVTPPDTLPAVVARAREAQCIWAKASFKQRRAVLNNILRAVLDNADHWCDLVVKDSGKTYENAMLGEILPVCNKLRWLIRHGERHLRSERVSAGLFTHKKARIEYVPLGVVACILPWNYPLQNIISSLVAPLMAGNAVIIKPSEAVAWSSQQFLRIVEDALRKEGFPASVVQMVQGYGDTGAALVRARVDKILFIGSVGNGRRIIQGSAEHLTPVIMELGGKDPFIVCDDADLDKALHAALGGAFINLGQNCIAAERIIVLDAIYDQFVERLAGAVSQFRQGVPVMGGKIDVGSITTQQQIQVIETLVSDAVSKGARVLTGGKRLADQSGLFFPPTVLADVTPDMAIAHEEVFGPVMLLMRVADDAQAIALANSTDFGLHSSVITRAPQRGERIAAALQAGATCINDFGLCYLVQDLPFGGVKYSGFGRMNGRDGLRAYTNPKAVLSDRWRLEIPPKLFPVGAYDYQSARSMIHVLYAPGLMLRLRHLVKLAWYGIRKRLA